MFCLPFLFNLRTRFGIEVIAAGIACGKCLVPMQANANHIGHCIIRLAHDGEDVPMTGPGCQRTEPAAGEPDAKGFGSGPLFILCGPVVLRLDSICLVYLFDIGVLILICEKGCSGILPCHDGDGVCRVAHPAVKLIGHPSVQRFHGLIYGKPYGAASIASGLGSHGNSISVNIQSPAPLQPACQHSRQARFRAPTAGQAKMSPPGIISARPASLFHVYWLSLRLQIGVERCRCVQCPQLRDIRRKNGRKCFQRPVFWDNRHA